MKYENWQIHLKNKKRRKRKKERNMKLKLIPSIYPVYLRMSSISRKNLSYPGPSTSRFFTGPWIPIDVGEETIYLYIGSKVLSKLDFPLRLCSSECTIYYSHVNTSAPIRTSLSDQFTYMHVLCSLYSMNAYFQHYFYLERKKKTQGGQGKRQAGTTTQFQNPNSPIVLLRL